MALDADGYPLKESLKAIETLDLLEGVPPNSRIPGGVWDDNLYRLLMLVRESWLWADGGFRVRKSGRLYLITGGWSGNEDVIDALGRNALFWGNYWYRTLRGGHWTFEIPRPVAKRMSQGVLL